MSLRFNSVGSEETSRFTTDEIRRTTTRVFAGRSRTGARSRGDFVAGDLQSPSNRLTNESILARTNSISQYSFRCRRRFKSNAARDKCFVSVQYYHAGKPSPHLNASASALFQQCRTSFPFFATRLTLPSRHHVSGSQSNAFRIAGEDGDLRKFKDYVAGRAGHARVRRDVCCL